MADVCVYKVNSSANRNENLTTKYKNDIHTDRYNESYSIISS